MADILHYYFHYSIEAYSTLQTTINFHLFPDKTEDQIGKQLGPGNLVYNNNNVCNAGGCMYS